jgi:hypothetical protein
VLERRRRAAGLLKLQGDTSPPEVHPFRSRLSESLEEMGVTLQCSSKASIGVLYDEWRRLSHAGVIL